MRHAACGIQELGNPREGVRSRRWDWGWGSALRGTGAAGDLPVLEMVNLHRPQPHLTGPPRRETRRGWRPAPEAARAGGRAGASASLESRHSSSDHSRSCMSCFCFRSDPYLRPTSRELSARAAAARRAGDGGAARRGADTGRTAVRARAQHRASPPAAPRALYPAQAPPRAPTCARATPLSAPAPAHRAPPRRGHARARRARRPPRRDRRRLRGSARGD
jgi:hypothetical protein